MNTSRYDNLVLAANTYRIVGLALKVIGTLLIVLTPIVAVIGASQGWGRSADPALASWPIVVSLCGLVFGVPLVIKGVTQAAHGEALVALADIAVATSGTMTAGLAGEWAGRSSRTSSIGAVVGFVAACVAAVVVGGLCTSSTVSRARHQALFTPGTQIEFFGASSSTAEWSGESDAKLHFGPGAKRRKFAFFQKRAADGHPLLVARATSGFASLEDAPLEYAPLSAMRVVEDPPPFVPVTPGANVAFDIDSTFADDWWGADEKDGKEAFGAGAARKKFSDSDKCVVGPIAGSFFACADAPTAYAPLSVARVLEAPKAKSSLNLGALAAADTSTPPPVAHEASSASAPGASAPNGITQRAQCVARVTMRQWRPSSPTCQFNSQIDKPGTVRFPCEGGPATATFGAQTFGGTVKGGEISLSHVGAYETGGCTWISRQSMNGQIASGQLSAQYNEGTKDGCISPMSACTATATLNVAR